MVAVLSFSNIKISKTSVLSFSFTVLLLLTSCKTSKTVTQPPPSNEVTFTFVQLNDVYEIAPLGGGSYGGMSRVAHVVDSIRNIEPNTFLVMAGDFLNPSLLGTLKVDGERLRGKHMIEVMNAMEFDLVTYGNHEFDLSEADFQKRLNESDFQWTSANVFQQTDEGPTSFYTYRNGDTLRIPDVFQLPIKRADTTAASIGVFSVTLDSNPQEYVYYSDYLLEAKTAYSTLKGKQADIVIGLTHLDIDQDKELAELFRDVPLIMGGHEHNHMLVPVDKTVIAKADAN
ncbi:MAG: metallophosphoesterase, partial [Marinirhabdus sp.]|nr:metallophosphoesterase [Marinirhabdus sp.]